MKENRVRDRERQRDRGGGGERKKERKRERERERERVVPYNANLGQELAQVLDVVLGGAKDHRLLFALNQVLEQVHKQRWLFVPPNGQVLRAV